MSPRMLRIARLELSLELALASGALLLFRAMRPSLNVGCGSSLSQMTDDSIEFFATHHLALVVPLAVAMLELNYAIRPWVRRVVRLGIGSAAIVAMGSYAPLVASFTR